MKSHSILICAYIYIINWWNISDQYLNYFVPKDSKMDPICNSAQK